MRGEDRINALTFLDPRWKIINFVPSAFLPMIWLKNSLLIFKILTFLKFLVLSLKLFSYSQAFRENITKIHL